MADAIEDLMKLMLEIMKTQLTEVGEEQEKRKNADKKGSKEFPRGVRVENSDPFRETRSAINLLCDNASLWWHQFGVTRQEQDDIAESDTWYFRWGWKGE
ncbi:unnamed protein product [Umbelopsis ramanniana]